ncbi:PorT family protein [Pontibacter sp. H259]|uniref:PorT family protein n=1 Tax=Pontibacter sp. H259 TaxID=3133421 RepID=UPI0030BD25E3
MKTNLLLPLFAFVLFVSVKPVIAQSDFREGYVVLPAGDTLRGQVNYRAGILAGNTCAFKQHGKEVEVNYTPLDIVSYGFPNDKNFQSRHLDHADTLAAEQVFMEELVRGTISLYTYKGTFFVQKKQDPKLHKLHITTESYYKYEKGQTAETSNGTLAVRRINHHVMALNMLMQDCFKMLSKTEQVSLSQKSLVALVREYNQCQGDAEQIVFKESKPWLAMRGGIIGGISHTSLDFSAQDEAYMHLEHAEFNTTTYPTLGLFLNINSPRISEHVSLQLEGQYFRSSYEAHPSYEWFGFQYDNNIAFNLAAVKGAAFIRYDFNGKVFQPFVNAGTFINFYQKREYTHRQYVKRTSTSNPEERIKDNPDFVTKRQQGFLGGAGTYLILGKRKFSAEARYEYGADLQEQATVNTVNDNVTSNTKTFAFLVGYYF